MTPIDQLLIVGVSAVQVHKPSELLLVPTYALKGAMGSVGVVPENLRSQRVPAHEA
jgi:hypothetical protein